MPRTTQIERIAVIETKVENIDNNVHDIHKKLDEFIESADNKYAEKTNVKEIEKQVSKMRYAWAYISGALAVIFIVVELAVNHFLK